MAIVIRRVSATEVSFANYDTFAAKCRGQVQVNYIAALNLSIEAANVGAELAGYKALLSFTLTELERETKAAYSAALLNAQNTNHTATSDPKREAVARQDATYIAKLTETAQIRALFEYVQDCLDHATKLHYIFKAIYSGETKLPVSDRPAF